jgi:hypothetical protein
MKRTTAVALMVLVLLSFLVACTKNERLLVKQAAPGGQAAPGAQTDPHAGTWNLAVPAGVGHKGKVVDVLNAGEYTYIQISENGKKLWVAAMSTKVDKGDEIEFADAPVFTKFQSKILNRTFDSLIFAAGIRDNGRK